MIDSVRLDTRARLKTAYERSKQLPQNLRVCLSVRPTKAAISAASRSWNRWARVDETLPSCACINCRVLRAFATTRLAVAEYGEAAQ